MLMISGAIFYSILLYQLKDNVDESLYNENKQIEKYLSYNPFNEKFTFPNNDIEIQKIEPEKIKADCYEDTSVYYSLEGEYLPYRVYKSFVSTKYGDYLIINRKPGIENEDLLAGVFISMLAIFFLLLAGLTFISRVVNKKLWQPFYTTIAKLKDYKLTESNNINFSKSAIKEFDELNNSLNAMSGKIYSDYKHQKEFNENASHEIQTPLAVIRAKLELLIQSQHLGNDEMELINSIYSSADKISRLNKELLLLAKIGNKQFAETERISLMETIDKVLKYFGELIELKHLQVKKVYKSDIIVQMSPTLCEIMASNLIQNAIRHNIENGYITIELTDNKMIIYNTGINSGLDTQNIFDRFKKHSDSKDSLGMGLAIVKEIVESNGFSITYNQNESLHYFTVTFS